MVDAVAPAGHLTEQIEGLATVHRPNGTGYLIASSQGEDTYAVYLREGRNEVVSEFEVIAGAAADGCTHTDGIDAVAGNLGPAYPHGLFVCQDDDNTASGQDGYQSVKYVRLDRTST